MRKKRESGVRVGSIWEGKRKFPGPGPQVSDKNLDDCTVHWGMTEEHGSLDGLVWSQQEKPQ